MEFIKPENADQILIPVELGGKQGRLVVEVAHRNAGATIYWHVDETFIGSTKGIHLQELNPSIGKHLITLVDEAGNTLEKKIEIVK